jgi:diguanylate cyclase (GGDEF)-like protein
MQATTEAIATNSLQTIEYQLGPGDMAGSPLSGPTDRQWFEGRLYPLRDRNQEIHSVVWMTINITEKKKLEEQVRDLAERDFLTGAYNRSHFMKIFEKEFSIAKRYRNRLAFLLLDIDNFKKINESYGIDTGDAVMKRLVILCEATLRNSDLFARYAGGAFSAMLPNTPRLGGAIIAERIRAAVEELRIPYGKETIRFTVSMGISLAQDTDTNSSGVLSRAEAALYQAKKKGRNRIEIG